VSPAAGRVKGIRKADGGVDSYVER